MKRFFLSCLSAIAGYVVMAFVGYGLIGWLSSNPYDSSVEAAMTSAFVIGPLGAVVAFVATFVAVGHLRKRRAMEN